MNQVSDSVAHQRLNQDASGEAAQQSKLRADGYIQS